MQDGQALDAGYPGEVADGIDGDPVVGVGQAMKASKAVLSQAGAAAGRAEAGKAGLIEQGRGGQAGAGTVGANDGDSTVFLCQPGGDRRAFYGTTGGIVAIELDREESVAQLQVGSLFVRQHDAMLTGAPEIVETIGRGRHHADQDRFAWSNDELLGGGATGCQEHDEKYQGRASQFRDLGIHGFASVSVQVIPILRSSKRRFPAGSHPGGRNRRSQRRRRRWAR